MQSIMGTTPSKFLCRRFPVMLLLILSPISAFLGTFALLAGFEYSLPRKESENDQEDEAWDASCVVGMLQHITDITKRSLYAVVKSAIMSKRSWIESLAIIGKRAVEFRGQKASF